MNGLLSQGGLAVLGLLVLFESYALRIQIRRTLALKRIFAPQSTPSQNNQITFCGIRPGEKIPTFEAFSTDSHQTVSTDIVQATSAVLLFASWKELESFGEGLEAFLSQLWNSVDGAVYLFLQGEQDAPDIAGAITGCLGNLLTVPDANGTYRDLMQIRSTPAAIQLGVGGVVQRVGGVASRNTRSLDAHRER